MVLTNELKIGTQQCYNAGGLRRIHTINGPHAITMYIKFKNPKIQTTKYFLELS